MINRQRFSEEQCREFVANADYMAQIFSIDIYEALTLHLGYISRRQFLKD